MAQLERDQFLAIQFDTPRTTTPCLALAARVLEQGILDYHKYRHVQPKNANYLLFKETEDWLFGEGGDTYLYSWHRLCTLLRLNPEQTRQAVLANTSAVGYSMQGRKLAEDKREERMLSVLERLGGTPTIGEVAKEARLAWQTARVYLEELEAAGRVHLARTPYRQSGRTRVWLNGTQEEKRNESFDQKTVADCL